jgi:hypothetical protein
MHFDAVFGQLVRNPVRYRRIVDQDRIVEEEEGEFTLI